MTERWPVARTRNGYVVIRAQLAMGDGMPPGVVPCHAIAPEACPGKRLVANPHRKLMYTVCRLFALRRQYTYEGSSNRVAYLVDALRVALGRMRHGKVSGRRCTTLCPDGANDVQVCGRVSSTTCTSMACVCSCIAHGAHGVVQGAWRSDDVIHRLTKTVAQEVAKLLRSTSRFRHCVSSMAQSDIINAVDNFGFATQRSPRSSGILVGLCTSLHPFSRCCWLRWSNQAQSSGPSGLEPYCVR